MGEYSIDLKAFARLLEIPPKPIEPLSLGAKTPIEFESDERSL
jgi:hypothetical protein